MKTNEDLAPMPELQARLLAHMRFVERAPTCNTCIHYREPFRGVGEGYNPNGDCERNAVKLQVHAEGICDYHAKQENA